MQVTIVGLGLIGSSLGLALRGKYGGRATVVGYDSDQSVHNEARKLGAVDRSEWNLDLAVEGSDVVILAAPANAIYDIFEAIGPYLKSGAVVMDTATTKRAILDWADELLPASVGFVGTDPLAGSGFSGQKDAHYNLFENKRFVVVPAVKAPESAVKTVAGIIEDVGGVPFFMDVDEHDSFSAAVNGLSVVVSAAMLSVASSSPSWREISRFIGSEFQAITVPSRQDPALAHATAVTNPDMMVHWLDQLIYTLQSARNGIADEETRFETNTPLADMFVNAWEQRIRIDAGIEPGLPTTNSNPLPTASESMMHLFLGRLGSRLVSRSQPVERDPSKYDRRRMR
jgi:prephenate dehydrogenase